MLEISKRNCFWRNTGLRQSEYTISRLFKSTVSQCIWNSVAKLEFTLSSGFKRNLGVTRMMDMSLPVTRGAIAQSTQNGEVQVSAGIGMKVSFH
jgi:hypothetical protein